MAVITFSAPLFRQQVPAYADETAYPDATIRAWWDAGACYISTTDYGYLSGDCRVRALNLMAAHLLTISLSTASGQVGGGIVQSSSIDKISVTVVPPPVRSQFDWWLGQTPYGAQLLALLKCKSAGGFYIGGAPERAGFRVPNQWGRFR